MQREARPTRWVLTFAGIHLVLFPMRIAGLYGTPRRDFEFEQLPQVSGLQILTSVGTIGIVAGAAITPWSRIHGLPRGAKAPGNSRGSRSLGWTGSAPPPPGNFAQIPKIAPDRPPDDDGGRRATAADDRAGAMERGS